METFSALLVFCVGNPSVTRDFPSQKPATRNFDIFFDMRLYKQLTPVIWDAISLIMTSLQCLGNSLNIYRVSFLLQSLTNVRYIECALVTCIKKSMSVRSNWNAVLMSLGKFRYDFLINRSEVESLNNGRKQYWALILYLLLAWTSSRTNNRVAGDLRYLGARETLQWWWNA